MTEPPSGHPPPARAELAGRHTVDLVALAEEICRRYRSEFPDEEARYGDAGVAWCIHDNQHILNWAVTEANGYGGFERQIGWLAGVLGARDFPVERLARDLEIAAAVVTDARMSEILLSGARFVAKLAKN